MKKTLFVLAMVLLLTKADAQRLKLQKGITADTIRFVLRFNADADTVLQRPFAAAFAKAISRFEQRKPKFTIVTESAAAATTVQFTLGATSYARPSESFWATVGNTAIVGAHTFMMVRFGWTIPVLFYWDPSTFTQMQVQIPPQLVQAGNQKTDFTLSSSAYFASLQRQQKRTVVALERTTYRLLRKLNRKATAR